MTAFLSARQIRIFDYPRFAEPLRDRVRERAAELAAAAGITIEHIANSHIRKEDVVAEVLAARGDHPGSKSANFQFRCGHDGFSRARATPSRPVIRAAGRGHILPGFPPHEAEGWAIEHDTAASSAAEVATSAPDTEPGTCGAAG